MIDITHIKLHSKPFAKLVKADFSINELKDGVVYVKTNNDSIWENALNKVKESYEVCGINNDNSICNAFNIDVNLIMPLFIPDRMEQYYIVGSVTNVDDLESAVSYLSIDAHNIIETFLPYVLTSVDDCKLKNALQGIYEEIETSRLTDELKHWCTNISFDTEFRGLVAPNPLATLGDAAAKAAEEVRKGNVSYKKKREKIMNLPSAGKKMKSDDLKIQEEGKKILAESLASLSNHEIVLLFRGLVSEIKPKSLNRILSSIADREGLGERTEYSIVFMPWESKYIEYGFDDNYKHCIFLKKGEILYPIKMGKSSIVIYTLSLIEKVTKNNKNTIVDIKANNKAFLEVYRFLFNDFNKRSIQERYEKLFKRNIGEDDNPIFRSGRLSENYNDLEASLAKTFNNLDEDYSPFLVNSTTPLAINAKKIELPEPLKAIKIH